MNGNGTLLVTGGAGFIGRHFVRHALAGDYRIVNLDALTYAGDRLLLGDAASSPDHRLIVGDICDRRLVRDLLARYRPDAILNLAAESHVDRSIDAPSPFVQTNILGTAVLLEEALAYWQGQAPGERDRFRFLQVSTDEVYGCANENEFFSERSPYAPNSPYAASKAAGDHLVRAFHRTYGLPTLIGNSSNNYGPYQFPEKLIPLAIGKALSEDRIPLYGDGSQVRDWIHVADHCDALLRILSRGRPGETYLVGASNTWLNADLVTKICEILDALRPRAAGRHADLIHFVADRPAHDRRYAIDASRVRLELDWSPNVAFEKGLMNTVRWYVENRAWADDIRRSRYAGDRLGLGPRAKLQQSSENGWGTRIRT